MSHRKIFVRLFILLVVGGFSSPGFGTGSLQAVVV